MPALRPAQFHAALAACLQHTPLSDSLTALAVAVSGGADSMALALLAAEYARAQNIRFCTFTVDHQLRPESAAEAAQVSAWMAARGIAHRTLVWNHGDEIHGNLLGAARDARYGLLTDACRAENIPALLLAHHQDDQAETLLHHLVRGSGVDGLSAMPSARNDHGIWLLRPLLNTPKTALIATCEAQSQPWVEDPTNQNARFSRTLMRELLASFPDSGLSAARLGETAQHMARAQEALRHFTALAEPLCIQHGAHGASVLKLGPWQAQPEEIRLRLLRRMLEAWQGAEARPRFASLEALQAQLHRPESGKHTLGPLLWHSRKGVAQCFPVASAVPTAMPATVALSHWKARGWQIALPETLAPETWLAPLGEEGWDQLCARDRESMRLARAMAPARAWAAVPCLWQAESYMDGENRRHYLANLLALPHIYPAAPDEAGGSRYVRFSAAWQPLL